MTSPDAAVDPPPLWRTTAEWAVGLAAGALLFAGIAALAYSCHADTYAAADAFFAELRDGEPAQAWASLAPERREVLDLEAFTEAVGAEVYAGHTAAGFGSAVSWGPVDGRYHACTSGSLTHEGVDWYAEVYLTQVPGDDTWRVHSWGVAEPSPMAHTLLEPCRGAW